MVLRILAAAFGVLELLFPRKIAEMAMDLTTEGTPEYEFKPWVYTLARLEGLVILVVALQCGNCKHKAESGDA